MYAIRPTLETDSMTTAGDRKLLAAGVRHPVRALDGLLHDPDLHPVQSDRRHLVGFLLVEPQRVAGARLARRHHCADHDDAHVVHQRRPAQNLLRQVHRHLPGHVLHHGLRLPLGYVTCFLSHQWCLPVSVAGSVARRSWLGPEIIDTAGWLCAGRTSTWTKLHHEASTRGRAITGYGQKQPCTQQLVD